MATLPASTIARLLEPYFAAPPDLLVSRLFTYLDLLTRWNAKTNLSAIRDPQEIVQRHFGESLFTSLHLEGSGTLLDLGSGAGFPGLPIALARPDLAVTLAESQNKKASFLREVVRTLGVEVEVWGGRAEDLPSARSFDFVTMRAVDRPQQGFDTAMNRVKDLGMIAHLTSQDAVIGVNGKLIPIPRSENGLLWLSR